MSDQNAQTPGAPSDPATSLRQGVRRAVWAQALATLVIAAVFAYRDGARAALAAAYGGAVTMLISGWFGWRLQRVGGQTPASGLGVLYFSTVLRYAAAIVLLALGLGVLRLAPLPLVIAFGLAQLGFLANVRSR